MSSENEAFLAAKQSYGYWRAGDAVLLGSRNPLCAETVATRPAARVQGAAARGSSHCKKPVLSLWPTSAEESCLSSPVFLRIVFEMEER